ncbi:MAG: tetratricopeptide repeat protein [Myxococcota bacterium]
MQPRSALLVAVLVTLAGGCTPPASSGTPADLPPIAFQRTLADGTQALSNLDRQISRLEPLAEQPVIASVLVGARLTRTQFAGHYSGFAHALNEAPDRQTRADVLAALHRFDEALAEAPSEEVEHKVQLARTQDLDALLDLRLDSVDARPSPSNWMNLAVVHSARGEYVDADYAYWEALLLYRDVSPLFVAQAQFQRGVMWGERADDPERARALYEDAVRILPGYVVANVHLAELEFEAGEVDSAVTRLQRMADRSQDPEPFSRLAQYAEDPSAAQVAQDRYEALLLEHRLAFADHAVEFFLGPGDAPERAWRLAQDNFRNRPTDRARRLAIEAALASGRQDQACSLIYKAADPVESSLIEVIEAEQPNCP